MKGLNSPFREGVVRINNCDKLLLHLTNGGQLVHFNDGGMIRLEKKLRNSCN